MPQTEVERTVYAALILAGEPVSSEAIYKRRRAQEPATDRQSQ